MKEIFLEKTDAKLTLEEWKAAGKPKMYEKFYTDGTVVAWDETAYGGLMLRVGDVIEKGKDLVINNGYVAIGYYFTGEASKIYKELKS